VKVFRVAYSSEFKSGYAFWQANDERKCKKIDELIKDTSTNPFKGIGKPEPLKHTLAGCWSRRIDQEHRLVYQIKGDGITFLQCRRHYD
jgi:toxin YoeB